MWILASIFEYTLLDGPEALWRLHWIGDRTLVLTAYDEFIRLDIDLVSLQKPVYSEEESGDY